MLDVYFIQSYTYTNGVWQRYETYHLSQYGKRRLLSSLKRRGFVYNRFLKAYVGFSDKLPELMTTIRKISHEK